MPRGLKNDGDGTRRENPIRITDETIKYINKLRPQYFGDDHQAEDLAFSATLPSLVKKDQPITIILMGKTGKDWRIQARPEEGYHPVYTMFGTFGKEKAHPNVFEQGDEYIVLQFYARAEPGKYEWFFWYDNKEIPNRFTPFVSRPELDSDSVVLRDSVSAKAIMEVVAEEPEMSRYRHEYTYKKEAENFGVDMYHPLLGEENSDPVFNPIDDIEAMAGDVVTVSLEDYVHDPDQDELVYDLRDANDNVFRDMQLNGTTGEIVFETTHLHIGTTYELHAFAKDGKGGIGQTQFNITVNEKEGSL